MKYIPALVVSLSLFGASPMLAQVREGDPAPLFVSLDQNMRRIDMADFIQGRPLVFWASSAT